jgi:two-component system alkaline phosphatase synthesis response regulator PhoP
MRILFVEDEENIRDVVKLNLEMDDYEVVAVGDGRKALKHFNEEHFDLIILDVMLPEMSGFQICEQIRLTNMEVPIIFLTAKDGPNDRIAGLKKGGDDYLTKPFHLEELLLRVNNLIRRTSKAPDNTPEVYEFGKNKINFRTFEAVGNDGPFMLTKKEAMLLKLLIDRKNEVVSRHQILQAVGLRCVPFYPYH